MVKLTQSLAVWLNANHPETMALIMFGHVELFTDEMQREYIAWCQTDDGKQYLKGGAKYDEEYAKRHGIELAATETMPILWQQSNAQTVQYSNARPEILSEIHNRM